MSATADPASPSPPSASFGAAGWGTVALLAGLVAWMFRGVLFEGGLLSYRDSLHFYYPLFDAIQQEWSAGRIPFWNPWSNCGEPLLASPTSCVFYPPRLLFFLPISYGARYHAYILLHLVLAGATCGWVARRWGASAPTAALAALSYALGGNVLFNYSNVVFLCGAAWLPLGLWSGARLAEGRDLRSLPPFSVALALMVLGGDPQLGYEAGLLTALYAALLWWRGRRPRPHDAVRAGLSLSTAASSSGGTISPRWFHNRLVLLGAAAGLAVLLAAVQVLPTREANKVSIREASDVPSSLWEVPGFLFGKEAPLPRPDTQRPPNWYDALVGSPPPPAKHALDVYGNSFAPWRVIEFLWPNVSGRPFPGDDRWGALLGWEPDAWVPSQYIGLWPFLLALAAWRLRRTDTRTQWLSLIALLSFLAAWGLYGPGWLLAALRASAGDRSGVPVELSGGVGGLYWLGTVLLPGFAGFRYPSKLLVLTTCSLSLLAARGLDGWIGANAAPPNDSEKIAECDRTGRWLVVFMALAVVSAVIFTAVWLGGDALRNALDARKAARNLVFDSSGAVQDIRTAALQTLILSGLSAVGIWTVQRTRQSSLSGESRRPGTKAFWPWGVVLVTAVDLVVANSALIHTVDRAKWEAAPALARVIQRLEKERGAASPRPVRLARSPRWIVPSVVPDPYPLSDRIDWQRRMMVIRQNLPLHVGVVMSYGTLDNNELEAWFDALPLPDRKGYLASRRAYDAWGTDYFVVDETPRIDSLYQTTVGLRTSWAPEGSAEANPLLPLGPPLRRVDVPEDGLPAGVQVLANDSAFLPAWIVHRVVPIEPIAPRQRDKWLPILMQLVYPQQAPFDLRVAAVVEDREMARNRSGKLLDWATSGRETAGESCRIVSYAPDRIEIEAALAAEGVVVLSETYAPGWQAEVSTAGGAFQPTAVLQTNRTMRGVRLPTGEHRIRMTYRPASFTWGAALSAMSWLGVLGFAVSGRGWWRGRVQSAI